MKTIFRLLLLCPFVLANFLADAQLAFESVKKPHGGGRVGDMGRIGNTLWQPSDGGLFYRSDDGGLTWSSIEYNDPFSFGVKAVGLDGNLYVHAYNKTHRSSDEGNTWQVVTSAGNHNFDRFFALPSGVLLGVDNNYIARSDDSGASWDTVSLVQTYRSNFIYDAATDRVYVARWYGDESGVLRSTDGGLTWEEIFTGDDLIDPPGFAVAPDGTLFAGGREDGKIWRSKDDGATWTGIPVTDWWNNDDTAENISITASGRIFCTFWYQTFFSDDGGDTWQAVQANWGQEFNGYQYVPGAGLFAVLRSIYRSTDDGANWQFAATGIHRGGVHHLAVPDDARYYAVTEDGVFTTADSGANWTAIYFADPVDYGWGEQAVVTTGPDGTVYLATSDTLLRSADAGANWVNIETPAPFDYYVTHFDVNPVTGTLYMGGPPELYISYDKGSTWQLSPNGSTLNLYSFQFAPDGTTYGHLSYKYLTVRTNDDFMTWDTIKVPDWDNWTDVFVGNAGFLLASRYPKAYRSYDGGLSWDSIQTSQPMYFDNGPVMNNANYIFGELGWDIGYSVDYGLTWQIIQPEYIYSSLTYPEYTFSPSQRLFVADGYSFLRTITSTSGVALLGGRVFDDPDINCAQASQEPLRPGFLVRAKNDDAEYFGTSNGAGKYLMPIETGDWVVRVVPPNDLWVSCVENVSVPQAAGQTFVDSVHIGLRAGELCPYMEVGIGTAFLRRCFPGQYVVSYCNTGTVPAEDAYLEVELDNFLIFQNASLPAVQSGQLLTFQLGTLASGQCGELTINFTVSCDAELGQVHCTSVHAYPDTICTETWNGSALTLRAECLGDKAAFDIHNSGASMPAPLDYAWHTSAGGATVYGNFQLAAGQSVAVEVPVAPDGEFIYFRHALENGYPYGTFRNATVHGCPVGSTDGASSSSVSGDIFEPFLAEDCRPNVGAFDPNDKQGLPAGIEDAHHIERGQQLTYLIRFQNTGTDTAFNVVVRDTLSSWLDPGTVHLDAMSHPAKMELSGAGNLAFYFYNILLPDSNINEATSHGFLRYSVAPRSNVPDGVRIENRAGIYFDYNEPVMTNTTWHTVGMPFPVVGVREVLTLTHVLAQPNPFREEIVFTAVTPELQLIGLQFEMSDVLGRVVHTEMVSGAPFHCLPGKIPAGPYMFRFSDSAGRIVAAGLVQKF